MKVQSHHIEAANNALAAILPLDRPADVRLSAYFRDHHELGMHDRAFVAETVFGILRHRRLIEHVTGKAGPRAMVLAYLVKFGGMNLRALEGLISPDEVKQLAALKATSTRDLPLEIQAEFPDWLVNKLRAFMPDDDILALGRALQQSAPLDLRVNTLRSNREQVLKLLHAQDIAADPTPYSPIGIRLKDKPALNRHPLFLEGTIEVQDEGSQLLGYLVAPRRHEMVVDFCAGAGGKSLMLGALMHSQGRIYAFDVSEKRLNKLKPRLKRSGLSNLHPVRIDSENDIKVKRLAGKIDRVLVDAPCSGLGTLRRNPDLKWRQSPENIEELKTKQAAILAAAANLLKPGGRLVYATCSLLPEENQEIVAAFLDSHPQFKPLDCAAILAQQKIPLDTGEYLQLFPHAHGTDGFFAAVMEKHS